MFYLLPPAINIKKPEEIRTQSSAFMNQRLYFHSGSMPYFQGKSDELKIDTYSDRPGLSSYLNSHVSDRKLLVSVR